jgi:hypothetical protein
MSDKCVCGVRRTNCTNQQNMTRTTPDYSLVGKKVLGQFIIDFLPNSRELFPGCRKGSKNNMFWIKEVFVYVFMRWFPVYIGVALIAILHKYLLCLQTRK